LDVSPDWTTTHIAVVGKTPLIRTPTEQRRRRKKRRQKREERNKGQTW
jgi:hypothetical protein